MKLTKEKLQQIIKEKIEESFRSPEEPEWDQFDVLERLWGSRETMTKEDLEGVLRDANLSIVPSDHFEETPPDDLETRSHEHEQGHWMEQKMKLTKSTLQQLIKEELENILDEDDELPRPALSYFKAMKREPESLSEMAALWDAILEMQDLDSLRDQAEEMGLAGSLATWHARKIDSSVEYPTGEELIAKVEQEKRADADHRAERAKTSKPSKARHPGSPDYATPTAFGDWTGD